MSKLISKNPATGETLAELEMTPVEKLPEIFEKARKAQIPWRALSPKKRTAYLRHFRETLLNHVDEISELISKENGKPKFEAMVHELLPSVECLTYLARKGPRLLRDKPVSMNLVRYRKSYINYWPLGVVAVIAPWNYPFMIPFCDIAAALITGNAVIFKPSEVTSLVGLKIQELADEAGIPDGLLNTVIGDGPVGAAIIHQKPQKVFFTGSPNTGRKIMAEAAQYLIPVNLELGGNNALVVLPDANLDYATSAALWGGFSNSGQICAATRRVIVHESLTDTFVTMLKDKLAQLRQSPSDQPNELGAITFEKQKAIYETLIENAKQKGATIVTGGTFSEDRRFLRPTVVTGPNIEELDIYNNEAFGPIVTVTSYKSVTDAIKKANQSKYGLSAAVITKDFAFGENVAKQLEAGTVLINEVAYAAGLPEAPWGGLKESGFGRTHSEIGLHEFVNIRHIQKPRSRLFSFKSPWWFPYSPNQYAAFRNFFSLYRRHWTDKLKGIPLFLVSFVQFIKREKRL